MNSLRKFLCVLAAVVLSAFALPAAAQKVYTFSLASTPAILVAGGTGQTVTGSMNNISPDTGNSTIKSFKLFAPNGYTITAPASGVLVNIGNGYTATIQNNGSSIYVSNINIPLKPFGTTLVLSMTVDLSCSATTGAWTITGPWNGGSFTGQTFAQQAPSNLTTNVNSGCTYSTAFQNQPKNAFAGYPITTTAFNNPTGDPIKVKYTINNGVPPVTQVSLTSNCAGLSGYTALTDGAGIATFSNLQISTAAAPCTLSASFGTSADTTLPFDIVTPAGTLSCAAGTPFKGNLDPNAVPPLGAPDWGLLRGLNRDGTCGANVPFTFTVDGTTNTAIFTEDSLGQPTSVEYIVRWKTIPFDNDRWSAFQPCASYGIDNPQFTNQNPLFPNENGVCYGDFVPVPGCLANDVNGPGDVTAVMPTFPDTYPYNLAGSKYPTGTTAKVCVAQQGWTSDNGLGAQYWDKLIDQTDTTLRGP